MEPDPTLSSGHRRLARLVDARMTELRIADPAIDALIADLEEAGPIAVVGGACVAWWHGHAPRDVDLAVDASADAIAAAMERRISSLTRNAFGGWKWASRGGIAIDFWPLAETWSIRREGREPTLRSLIDLVTFDWSGIAVAIGGGVVEDGWFQAMETRCLDLRYGQWPYAFMLAGKALSLHRTLGARPTPKLREWIRAQRADTAFTERQWRDAAARYAPDLDPPAFLAALDRLGQDV